MSAHNMTHSNLAIEQEVANGKKEEMQRESIVGESTGKSSGLENEL